MAWNWVKQLKNNIHGENSNNETFLQVAQRASFYSCFFTTVILTVLALLSGKVFNCSNILNFTYWYLFESFFFFKYVNTGTNINIIVSLLHNPLSEVHWGFHKMLETLKTFPTPLHHPHQPELLTQGRRHGSMDSLFRFGFWSYHPQ